MGYAMFYISHQRRNSSISKDQEHLLNELCGSILNEIRRGDNKNIQMNIRETKANQ